MCNSSCEVLKKTLMVLAYFLDIWGDKFFIREKNSYFFTMCSWNPAQKYYGEEKTSSPIVSFLLI